ncbi:hypothetical protein BT63DRAFT_472660 [Microthyrium microscopicum]|uniref:BTB domain-containing protein n=1 Tax=Microthyrium microscopicum TaxID=703497 RepID=A0A6A6U8R6_9PEZI|nr:hypothetical protein BT63DRAFT_472660 [Microthyrium microscopicum]
MAQNQPNQNPYHSGPPRQNPHTPHHTSLTSAIPLSSRFPHSSVMPGPIAASHRQMIRRISPTQGHGTLQTVNTWVAVEPPTKRTRFSDVRSDQDLGHSFAQETTVQILVGEEEQVFAVHQHLLRSNSEYFKAMLRNETSGGFKENVEGQIKLPDVSVKLFNLFVQFLYHGKIFSAYLKIEPPRPQINRSDGATSAKANAAVVAAREAALEVKARNKAAEFEEYKTLMELIVFADYLQSDSLHNAAIEALIQTRQAHHDEDAAWVNNESISLAKGVPELLNLLRDSAIHESRAAWWTGQQLEDKGFWMSVAGGMAELLRPSSSVILIRPWEDSCRYHRHSNEPKCS